MDSAQIEVLSIEIRLVVATGLDDKWGFAVRDAITVLKTAHHLAEVHHQPRLQEDCTDAHVGGILGTRSNTQTGKTTMDMTGEPQGVQSGGG